jgi:Histone deacetylase domain
MNFGNLAAVQVIEPLVAEFAPDLVLVSAGFDAAEGDPLGGMKLSPAGTRVLQKLVNIPKHPNNFPILRRFYILNSFFNLSPKINVTVNYIMFYI